MGQQDRSRRTPRTSYALVALASRATLHSVQIVARIGRHPRRLCLQMEPQLLSQAKGEVAAWYCTVACVALLLARSVWCVHPSCSTHASCCGCYEKRGPALSTTCVLCVRVL